MAKKAETLNDVMLKRYQFVENTNTGLCPVMQKRGRPYVPDIEVDAKITENNGEYILNLISKCTFCSEPPCEFLVDRTEDVKKYLKEQGLKMTKIDDATYNTRTGIHEKKIHY